MVLFRGPAHVLATSRNLCNQVNPSVILNLGETERVTPGWWYEGDNGDTRELDGSNVSDNSV